MAENRSMSEIAKTVYPNLPSGVPSEDGTATKPLELRSDEEIAASVYPQEDPRLAPMTDAGQIGQAIRDVDGRIIFGADVVTHYSDERDMLQFHRKELAHGDLEGIDFQERDLNDARLAGADLRNTRFGGSLADSDLRGADLRGADLSGADLRNVDLTGAKVDSSTNLANANLTGAKYSYASLKRCAGADRARGLRMDPV